ncbi:MAG: metallophosphoesterase, partial [Gemmataceae bacterium]|nr:metallophosphoesterase [Gemmataceae bacterium]
MAFSLIQFASLLVFVIASVGHAVLWTAVLNHLYGRPLPKSLLRLWRYATAVLIASLPLGWAYFLLTSPVDTLAWVPSDGLDNEAIPEFHEHTATEITEPQSRPPSHQLPEATNELNHHDKTLRAVKHLAYAGHPGTAVLSGYVGVCLLLGGFVFPAVSWRRWRRRPPPSVRQQRSQWFDFWPEHGPQLIGDGCMAWAARLPGNDIFRLEVTELTLALPRLPAACNNLRLLVLSDFHFHGTPTYLWFERVLTTLAEGPTPDLVCLLGDYVDRDSHRAWIVPLLTRLHARYGKLAILGNHDVHHDPMQIRTALQSAGCRLVGPAWQLVPVRGTTLAVIGHEGPWLPGPQRGLSPPADFFRLALSHTPDN